MAGKSNRVATAAQMEAILRRDPQCPLDPSRLDPGRLSLLCMILFMHNDGHSKAAPDIEHRVRLFAAVTGKEQPEEYIIDIRGRDWEPLMTVEEAMERVQGQ